MIGVPGLYPAFPVFESRKVIGVKKTFEYNSFRLCLVETIQRDRGLHPNLRFNSTELKSVLCKWCKLLFNVFLSFFCIFLSFCQIFWHKDLGKIFQPKCHVFSVVLDRHNYRHRSISSRVQRARLYLKQQNKKNLILFVVSLFNGPQYHDTKMSSRS